MSSDKYRIPPVPPKPMMKKKYFYTILFIKSFIYNVKGQAIIFRRRTLESLMKLLNDFDETYLHSSYEHSYQTKRLSQGNVDFIVKYTDKLDSVIKLIDQNAYVVKYSWLPKPIPGPCQQIPIPEPVYPPVIPMPYPPQPVPPPFVPDASGNSAFTKKVKITKIYDNGNVEVRNWDDIKNRYTGMLYIINIGEDSKNWGKGDIAILVDGKLQKINSTPSYRRVKIMDVSKIGGEGEDADGTIGIADFDDVKMRVTSNTYYISLKSYCYGDKIPDWAKDDDALLIDNKYLIKIDVGTSTEEGYLPEDLQNEGNTTFDPDYNSDDNTGDGGNNPPLPPPRPPFPFYPPCFNLNNPRCYNCSLSATFPQNPEDGMTFICNCDGCNTNNNETTPEPESDPLPTEPTNPENPGTDPENP